MPDYSNGYIPGTLLTTFKVGWNATDGTWSHSLSPATYARHLSLVNRAYARTGRTLTISEGWGAYRPYAAQVIARNVFGNGAAVEGTSSHGGFWEGQQTLAMDYSNWSWVYGGDRDAFASDCAAVGLTANLIVPARGYPDEPWHVVDLNPWSAAPAFESATAFPETSVKKEIDVEAIVIVPSGSVVHFFPGGKSLFGSQQEYETYRTEVEFIRERGGIDVMALPPLGSVVGVSWATYERLRKNFGAPADNVTPPELVDVEALASKLAAKLNVDPTVIRAAVRAELATLTLKVV